MAGDLLQRQWGFDEATSEIVFKKIDNSLIRIGPISSTIYMVDNTTSAYVITEGANPYFRINTNNGTELISFDKKTVVNNTLGVSSGIGIGISAPGAAAYFIDAELTITGSDMTCYVINNETANTSSGCVYRAIVGGAGAGDPKIQFTVAGAADVTLGIDNSVGDNFCISIGSVLGSNVAMYITPSRLVVFPDSAGVQINDTLDVTGQVTGNFNGGNLGEFTFYASADTPKYAWNESDAAADNRLWTALVAGGQFILQTDSVDGGTARNFLHIIRTGTAISSMDFGNSTNNPTYTFLGTGLLTVGGNLIVTRSSSGGTVLVTTSNTNSGSGSSARHLIEVTSTTGASDSFSTYSISGGQAYSLGLSNSDNDRMKICRGSDLSATPVIAVATDGLLGFFIGGTETQAVGAMWVHTADTTVANTVTQTTLLNSGVGTKTLIANSFRVGRVMRIKASGYYQTTGTPIVTLIFKFGAIDIIAPSQPTLSTIGSNHGWMFEGTVTCISTGASGEVKIFGVMRFEESSTSTEKVGYDKNYTGGALNIDTTGSLSFDFMATWSAASASNTITCRTCEVEFLN